MIASEIEQLRRFLRQVAPRLDKNHYEDVDRYIREAEWQLAVELIADSLDERAATLDAAEWATFSELATSVHLDPAEFTFLRAVD